MRSGASAEGFFMAKPRSYKKKREGFKVLGKVKRITRKGIKVVGQNAGGQQLNYIRNLISIFKRIMEPLENVNQLITNHG